MTAAPSIETADLTVVVATRNRRDRLMETLPRHAAPVILVDNGSDDGTPEAVEAARRTCSPWTWPRQAGC